jgi:hypothetical protein
MEFELLGCLNLKPVTGSLSELDLLWSRIFERVLEFRWKRLYCFGMGISCADRLHVGCEGESRIIIDNFSGAVVLLNEFV